MLSNKFKSNLFSQRSKHKKYTSTSTGNIFYQRYKTYHLQGIQKRGDAFDNKDDDDGDVHKDDDSDDVDDDGVACPVCSVGLSGGMLSGETESSKKRKVKAGQMLPFINRKWKY